MATVLEQRLLAIKQKYERGAETIAPELKKLGRTHPPSFFAFSSVFFMAVVIDVFNIFLDITLVGDLILSIIFLLCIRSLINRPLIVQRLIAVGLIGGTLIGTSIPFFGAFIIGPIFMVVMLMGIMNPGVSIHKVDKDKVVQHMQNLRRSIITVRQQAARLIRIGRRTRALRSLTARAVRSKPFRAFSKGSRTTTRLLGFAAAESVVFLAWVPFNTLNVILTYRDLKRAHEEAGELLADYRGTEKEAITTEATVAFEQEAGARILAQTATQQLRETREVRRTETRRPSVVNLAPAKAAA